MSHVATLNRLAEQVEWAVDSQGQLTRAGKSLVRTTHPMGPLLGAPVVMGAAWTGWSYWWFDYWVIDPEPGSGPSLLFGIVSVVLWLAGVAVAAHYASIAYAEVGHGRKTQTERLLWWHHLTDDERCVLYAKARRDDKRAATVQAAIQGVGKAVKGGWQVFSVLSGFDPPEHE